MIVVSADEITGAYFKGFPDEFNQDVLRVLATIYKGTHDQAYKKYRKPEAHDVYPHNRRADIETELTNLVESRYPEIKSTPELNVSHGSFHRLFSSEGVILTQHFVQEPSTPVRPAIFREVYQRTSQYSLFPCEEEESESVKTEHEHSVYVQLKHGSDGKHLDRPSFVQIVIPDKDGKVHLPPIDLLARYPKLVASLWAIPVEEKVEDTLEGFKLKAGVKETAEKERRQGKKEDQTG